MRVEGSRALTDEQSAPRPHHWLWLSSLRMYAATLPESAGDGTQSTSRDNTLACSCVAACTTSMVPATPTASATPMASATFFCIKGGTVIADEACGTGMGTTDGVATPLSREGVGSESDDDPF
mmetsp:Transcript_33077/g.65777  ORF Transcript_33077/g.65777 Transcript_33077/m.65777 type:complete len:123 (+) Transcript_33077:403-771(+)